MLLSLRFFLLTAELKITKRFEHHLNFEQPRLLIRGVVLNVIKKGVICARISYWKLPNFKARLQVGIILFDKNCHAPPKMLFILRHVANASYSMWGPRPLSLKLDSVIINPTCSIIEEHVNWRYIIIVPSTTFPK